MFAYEPYVECRLRGDSFLSHFSNGLTMTGGETSENLYPVSGGSYTDGKEHFFTLHKKADGEAFRYCVELENRGKNTVIEMLASFSCRLGEFDKLWRLQSFWSAEGRVKTDTLTGLHLIPSWAGFGVRSEKFCNLGSMPVRGYFPFAALENSKTGEFLGISLSCPSSWQFELLCRGKEYILSCGLADADTGHFCREIKTGEHFTTPEAIVAAGNSFEDVCRKLLTAQHPHISPKDPGMDIIFNEFCTTWGNPSHENLHRIVDKIKGRGISTLVIDAGWYRFSEGWGNDLGDWNPNAELFPQGLKAVADEIRAAGMIPGIWFELENAGSSSQMYQNTEHLLKRNGIPLTVGNRRFLDMNDPWVIDYLSRKVIGLLRDCGFGYLKIDYNETIGAGCDNADSLGEGARRQMEGTLRFFRKLRTELPDLIIELCSSGGHRLVPAFLEEVSQASFSDAHETVYIPIIAANLQRVVLPKQSQIWAVLHKTDSDRRLQYSLINTLLGRMCLSGDVYDLTEAQWKIVEDGMTFYRKAADIIQHGRTIHNCCTAENLAEPAGNQLIIRQYRKRQLIIAHRFADSEPVDTAFLHNHRLIAHYGLADADFSAEAWLTESVL